MKKQMNYVVTTGILAVLIGCAHKLEPVKMDSGANTKDELSAHGVLMNQAYVAQVDVMAPEEFNKARKYYSEAKEENEEGSPTKEVFEALGYSKSYLNQATQVATDVKVTIADVATAREKALTAGARTFKEDLEKIDNKLMDYTDESKVVISTKERLALQNEYLDLELVTIKHTNLSSIKKTLDKAKDNDAKNITPKAYEVALQQYNVADKVIETDRHSTEAIKAAVLASTESANRVMGLLDYEKKGRNQTPEQRAVNLESKDIALKNSDAATTAVLASSLEKDNKLSEKDQKLKAQGAILANTEEQNSEMKAKELDEQAVKEASERFDTAEADVYRQDGLLIIRLKSMNFASGRSDLPASSMSVLAKVKDVIRGFGPGSVTVEGHTDGVGAAKVNQQLSEKRAESVVKYFTSDDLLGSNKMDFVGFGYSKPLGTNKTKEGRSQNRRVDVIIKPNHAI